MNNYKKYGLQYVEKNLSAIPDKYASKQPAIKGWSDYCYKLPNKEEVESWSKIGDTNLAVCLGEASGIVALDIDTDAPELLAIIEAVLPESPVEKRGSKGYTRFFKYMGENTTQLKHNGHVILEVLSNGKKTTLPPSKHPNGCDYVWTTKETLLTIDINKLPIFPPMLVAHLSSKFRQEFPDAQQDGFGKTVSGRNNGLSSYLGGLINEPHDIDTVVKKLIDYDEKENETPYFSDPSEMRHTDVVTNVLMFYTSHLNSINTKRYREKKEYLVPQLQTSLDVDALKELQGKKLPEPGLLKKPNKEASHAQVAKMISTYFTKEAGKI